MADEIKNVLIVDDTKFMRHMLREIFEKQGLNVIGEAANGKEGVSMYEEFLPDLTTLDISMPEMDGIETLKKIMEIDPTALVVMVSALGYKDKIMEAVKAGAKNFIVKPFTEEKVVGVIKPLLNKS
jgi:two-component system chemotaxis response regulator CheY